MWLAIACSQWLPLGEQKASVITIHSLWAAFTPRVMASFLRLM